MQSHADGSLLPSLKIWFFQRFQDPVKNLPLFRFPLFFQELEAAHLPTQLSGYLSHNGHDAHSLLC